MSNIDQYFDIDRMMADNELLLAYREHITEDTIHQLLSITEIKLKQRGEEKKLRKRIFNILVECLQNVVNHTYNETKSEEVASILLIGKNKNEFFIVTGNQILNSKIEEFEKRVKEINSWNHSDMRKIYSMRLGKSEYSEKGGAGLGLVDMYKRSGRKIVHGIQPINDKISFLSLHISIGSNN